MSMSAANKYQIAFVQETYLIKICEPIFNRAKDMLIDTSLSFNKNGELR